MMRIYKFFDKIEKNKFSFSSCIFIVFFKLSYIPVPVFAASEMRSAGTYSSAGAAGQSDSWTGSNSTNLSTQNDVYAAVTGATNLDADGDYTNYSKGLSWGFTMSDGSTINGIELYIDHFDASGFDLVSDKTVQLSTGNSLATFVGNNKARTTTLWPSTDTDTYTVYGGSADTWGYGWTAAEIKASNFSVFIQAQKYGAGTDDISPSIDHYYITVYYTAPLPIELLSFTTKNVDDKYVLLEWNTASEINNHFVEVQKSTDGIHWFPIDTIMGGEDKFTYSTYYSRDTAPATGINYYRLRQVDHDGTEEISHIVFASVKQTDLYVSVWPNPVTDALHIQLASDTYQREAVCLQLHDDLGRMIMNINIDAADSNTPVPVSFLSKGVYFLSVSSRRGRHTEKLIIN